MARREEVGPIPTRGRARSRVPWGSGTQYGLPTPAGPLGTGPDGAHPNRLPSPPRVSSVSTNLCSYTLLQDLSRAALGPPHGWEGVTLGRGDGESGLDLETN